MSDLPVGVRRVVEAMHGMARNTITATSADLVPLDREQRRALLSGIDSKEVLVALGEMQAELDAAMLSSAPTLPLGASWIRSGVSRCGSSLRLGIGWRRRRRWSG
ncbi:hypothetical protein [Mycolicibacterium tusciae]|uniref:hypothetical protein n=1 Tax=Mycolicibacterium tusciae TaxID=75922 RepID=UPI00024A364F|nr:hypothetical protein [Mycolicibacterium tusciae]